MQHKEERWRGVIVGWERVSKPSPLTDRLTSLTTKSYSDQASDNDNNSSNDDGDGNDRSEDSTNVFAPKSPIQYTMILDSGDAHFLGGRRVLQEQTGFPVASQDDLELVMDIR